MRIALLASLLCGSTLCFPAFTQTGACPETFIQLLGTPDQAERGYGVYDAGDGNLYLTGLQGESALISKVNPAGGAIWTRTFNFSPGQTSNISELIVDSEGMIVGCGILGEQLFDDGFVFRYDPVNDQMLWYRQIETLTYVYGILEPTPGGHFTAYANWHESTQDDALLMEIDRNTGAPISFKRYNLGSSDAFRSAVVHGDALYLCGRYTKVSGFDHMRQSISKFTLDGTEVWSKLYHVSTSAGARLYGNDLIVDEDHLITIGSGNDFGTSLAQTSVFLQKMDLDGNMLWIRKFTLAEFPGAFAEEVVATPDGYVIYGHNRGAEGGLFLLKVNKNGTLLWARKIQYAVSNGFSAISAQQSQLLAYNGYLYGTAFVQNPGEQSDMIFFKIDDNGQLYTSCEYFEPTDVAVFAPPPFTVNETLTVINHQENSFGALHSSQVAALPTQGICRPTVNISQNIGFCPGNPVFINGIPYDQPGTVYDTITAGAYCDTIVVYELSLLPQVDLSETILFCPGDSITLHGMVYDQSGTVVITLPGNGAACDTVITYTLVKLTQPTQSLTVEFCKGDTVWLNGNAYTQPGTVEINVQGSAVACDTLVTYTLQYANEGQVSALMLQCPADVSVSAGDTVHYDLPIVDSDCACPGIELNLTSGFAGGEVFPTGNTEVCFSANDSCGSAGACCFQVTVNPVEEEPCDVKILDCLRFEAIAIFIHPNNARTYRMRLINNCQGRLMSLLYQMPSSITAYGPANNSTYTAPSGRTYTVRNPHYSPIYGIQFKPQAPGIHNGESDIFEYTLPPQAYPLYFSAVARVEPNNYTSVHMSMHHCPMIPVGNRPENADRSSAPEVSNGSLYPNPNQGELFFELPEYYHQEIQVRLLDAQGRILSDKTMIHGEGVQQFLLPEQLPNGLYLLDVRSAREARQTWRFFLQR